MKLFLSEPGKLSKFAEFKINGGQGENLAFFVFHKK
jgi:hypothetical protein